MDISPAVPSPQELSGLYQLAHGFGFLGPPFQFLEVGLFFRHLVIADEGGNKQEVGGGLVLVCPQDHVQEAQFGHHQLAGAAPASLDKKLQVITAADHGLDIGVKHLGVELSPQEAAADEKGPGAPEDRAQRPEGQVFARGNPGRVHIVLVNQIIEDEIVEMALVTGDENEAATLPGLFDPLEAFGIEGDAVKEVFRQPGDHWIIPLTQNWFQSAEISQK